MDFNYLLDSHHHPDANHQHHDSNHQRHLPQYPPQQYPPAHNVLHPGYPGIRFAPFVSPFHEPSQSTLPSPRGTASQPGVHPFQEVGDMVTSEMQAPRLHLVLTQPTDELQELPSTHQQRHSMLPSTVPSTQHSRANPSILQPARSIQLPPPVASVELSAQPPETPVVDAPELEVPVEDPPALPQQGDSVPRQSAATAPNSQSQSSPRPGPSLPVGLSYRQNDSERITGVFAEKHWDKDKTFGPFTGAIVSESSGSINPTTWEMCIRGKVWFYVDGKHDRDNWMVHVRCARNDEEQNLEAVQYYGNIYFRTTKTIDPGAELRVFYSQEYGRHVGFKTGLRGLTYLKESNKFECDICTRCYTMAKSLLRHVKFEHDLENCPPKETVDREPFGDDIIPATKSASKQTTSVLRRRTKSTQNKMGREKAAARDQRFICTTCGKSFPTQGRLLSHESFHDFTKIGFTCEVCGLELPNSTMLSRHLLSHNPLAHKCDLCGKFYTHKKHLMYHLRHHHGTHTKKDKRKTTRSKKATGKKQTRKVHLVEEEDEESATVPNLLCPRDMLGEKINAYQSPRPYKCRYCSRQFQQHYRVLKHEKEVHTGGGKYKCDYCPLTFMDEYRSLSHIRQHTKDRPFKCSVCPRSFASEQALTNHQGEHTGAKPFKCEYCDRGFNTKKNLAAHRRRLHLKTEKRWACSICNKKFREKGGLVRHERLHRGIRPFVCLTCGKAFTSKVAMLAHTRIHTGEKPYECRQCGKRFALNHHLSNHLFVHEKEKRKRHEIMSNLTDGSKDS